jgi:hypothetical protein
MPMPIQSVVGPAGPAQPLSILQPRLGPTGELVENQMYGKYYEATRLGLVYTAVNAAAGAAIPQATSTTQQFVLFNPPASGKRAILIKVNLGYVSATMTAGCIVYSVNTSVVNAVTGTPLTINNNFNGGPGGALGASSAMQAFSGATVVAMTLLRAGKYSQVVQAATSTNSPWQFDEDLDGSIVIGPGGAFSIGGNITLGTVSISSVTWIELPHVVGA